MKASLGGQITIALGIIGLASVLWKALYALIRYIQWLNMAIIYVARKTGTPLPVKLLDQYHQLPYNGYPLDHVLKDDPPEESGSYPLPSRPKKNG
jgi:hypothetical protein